MNQTRLDPKLKTKASNIKLTQNLISSADRTREIRLSNLSNF
jgi:hypothetical protein